MSLICNVAVMKSLQGSQAFQEANVIQSPPPVHSHIINPTVNSEKY